MLFSREIKERWSERGVSIRFGEDVYSDFGDIVRSAIKKSEATETLKLNLERVLVEIL